ncbi:IS1 family transposase [Bacillus sp. AGMB 02131]|uniref:IS1 family transposase n=1 Tax=Peribacillus faecalis TaxID=2772559 RepID=A0A927HC89_9BACI|nr:IS1 family transposase [Peribacillus faecalis]MBD3108173.1 IS1 family transposase [Peribacillus faecalis]
MAKQKRLVTKKDEIVAVTTPITNEEIKERNKQYSLLAPKRFATKFNELLFKPVEFQWNSISKEIQINHCTNPYCASFGMKQEKFPVKGKPSRYKLNGTGESKTIKCNPNLVLPTRGMSLGCYTRAFSNWSLAEEISRLVHLETIKEIEPQYIFHKEGCAFEDFTPFNEPNSFYKQGKSKVGAQRWQCKSCKKKTNIMPNTKQSIVYNQQRNDIVPTFAKLLLNKTPVSRTCEVLGIGRGTYYQKLEWLYRRCLEFLERYETKPLSQLSFKEVWLNTDKMTYLLNNIRRKGMGGKKYDSVEDTQFPTNVVITAEVFSRYVLRSDIAYDWDASIEEIALDTFLLKEDHLNEFAKRHARLRFSHFPQPPSDNDTQTEEEYRSELLKVERRDKYIEGLHVNSTYTTMAHYWLIKQLLNSSEWRFVTDRDSSLMTACYRIFSREFQLSDAHHFVSQIDKTKTRKQAYEEFKLAQQDLYDWGIRNGHSTRSLKKLAFLYLEDAFQRHQFHEEIHTASYSYKQYANNPIEHPLATPDRGFREVDCTTDLSSLEPSEIAHLMLNVNDNAANAFIQNIRRRLSILERPLMTARGDGKSYIYSNFNPKYAQMALTILRTYYNFCIPFTTKEGAKKIVKTPAQRLGITDKVFNLKDIIYLR